MRDKTIDVFFALMRAGLWEKEIRLLPYQDIQWQNVYRLAAEQSVLGLVLAGLEHSDLKPPQKLLLQWIGEVQIIEKQNKDMNIVDGENAYIVPFEVDGFDYQSKLSPPSCRYIH